MTWTARRVAAELAILELEVDVRLFAEPQPFSRPLHPHERHVDFPGIDSRLDEERAAIVALLAAGRSLAVRILGDDLRRVGGPVWQMVARLHSPTLAATASGVATLHSALAREVANRLQVVVHTAVEEAADELRRQGLPVGGADTSRAQAVVQAQVRRLAAVSWALAVRQMQDAVARVPGSSGMDAKDVVDQALDQVDGASTRSLNDAAGQGVSAAFGAGRLAGLLSLVGDVPVVAYASEVMDRATCGPCDVVDGTEYDTLADAVADYPDGQYVLCEGGPRCRGTLVMLAGPEAA